ncbi:MAG: hypothetical protein QOK29_610, partial [Rhodospirillaceae bacterium]|nr:hypothetical protein [Rhodospirillaceae bacterium]
IAKVERHGSPAGLRAAYECWTEDFPKLC